MADVEAVLKPEGAAGSSNWRSMVAAMVCEGVKDDANRLVASKGEEEVEFGPRLEIPSFPTIALLSTAD